MAKSVLINILGNPASALAALEEVGIKAQETAKKTAGIGESSDRTSSKFGAFAKFAAGGLVVAAVAMVDMGNKLEDARVMLDTAIKDAGGNLALLSPQIAAVDKRMESLGYTNAQTDQALATMTIGLHNASKAMDLIGLAADIARARHIDLATAATLVVKASEGQTMALRRAGIDLPVMASSSLKVKTAEEQLAKAQDALNTLLKAHPTAVEAASKSHAKYEAALLKVQAAQTKLADLQQSGGQIIDALSQRYRGQASAAADTFSGRMEVMRVRIEDVGARIGIAMIPILEKLMVVISRVIGWFEKHRTAAILLAAVIGGMLVASAVAWVAALSPVILTVGAVVLAVGGMIAIGIALKNNWDTILRFLRSGFGTLVQVIILGPFAIISLLALHWQQVWDGMKTAVYVFVGFFQGIIGWFARLPGQIVGFFSGVGDGIASFFEQIPGRIWNNVIMPIWNFFVTLPGSIVKLFEHLGSDIVHTITSNIPGSGIIGNALNAIGGIFEEGGYVPGQGPQLAIVHGGEYVLTQQDVAGLRHPGGAGRFSAAGGAAGAPGGDLVLQVSGREFARVAGPDFRTWLLQGAKKNSTRVGLA